MKQKPNRRLVLTAALGCAAWGAMVDGRADYSSQVAGLKPVAYYRLNTTNEVPTEVPAQNAGSLGAAAKGQFVGVPTRGIKGALAGDSSTACSFDGTSQHVTVPWSKEQNPSGAFTVEAWLNPASDASGLSAPLNSGHMADPRSGWLLYQNGPDGWSFRMYNQDGLNMAVELAGGGPVAANTWYHVVAVYDGTKATLYVDGKEAATGTPTSYVANTDGALTIGARSDLAYRWKGAADEVAIYGAALPASEVLAHYRNGIDASRTTPYSTLVQNQKPLVYYRLDEPMLALPVAANTGSLGAAADGQFLVGTVSASAGPRWPSFQGFEATNSAAGFKGAAGFVKVPPLNVQSDSATFACWLKRNGNQPARAGILHNRTGSGYATGLGFHDAGNSLSYNWNDLQAAYDWNPGFVVPDQAWTFVAVTVTPENAVMYMGTSAGLVAATNAIAHELHDFSLASMDIGYDNIDSTRVFKGSIDEVAIFDKALSFSEVSSLFASALPGVTLATRAPADPVYEGMSVTFTAAAAGTAPIGYQWRKNGQPLTGKTGTTLVLNNVTTGDSGDYDCVASNATAVVTSETMPLTVSAGPPIFVQQPASIVRSANGTATFAPVVYGSQPITFQWRHGQTDLPGATSATLTIRDLQAGDSGDYTLVAANAVGAVTSSVATLTIQAVGSSYESAVVNFGPTAYWRLNESAGATTALDGVGGHNAAHTAVTTGEAGPQSPTYAGFEAKNVAASYDGKSGMTSSGASLLSHAKQFTMLGWIKLADTQPLSDRIGFFGQNDVVEFGISGGQVTVWTSGGGSAGFDSGELNPGQWYFLAVVGDGQSLVIYRDGEVAASGGSATSDYGNSTYAFNIASTIWDASGNNLAGAVDEVAVFDRALTAAEIQSLATVAQAGPSAPQIVSQPASQTVLAGDSVELSVGVTGGGPYTYQWKRAGTEIPGATRRLLSFPSATAADSGTYEVAVSNSKGSKTSQTATLTVVPVPTYANLTNGLVVHLGFDGNVTDSSGRGNHGQAVGQPTYVAGKIGDKALRYSTDVQAASYNYVNLGKPSDLQFGVNASFSVAFWIRFSGLPGDLPFFSNARGSYTNPGFTLAPSYQQGGWSWYLKDTQGGPGAGLYGPQATLNDGEWHHLVHVFDRSARLAYTYLDGVRVDATAFPDALDLNTGDSAVIGQDPSGEYSETATAEIDDFGVWRRALADYEARSIYIVSDQYGRSFDVAAPKSTTLTVKRVGGELQLDWESGTLEAADQVNGAYAPVAGASAPSHKVTPSGASKFYRVKL